MRRFTCPHCGSEVFFTNTVCVNCRSLLGYDPKLGKLEILVADPSGAERTRSGQIACANRQNIGCNWTRLPSADGTLCLSCRHTIKIPDISDTAKQAQWARLEQAKRGLFYALLKFGLPMDAGEGDQKGFLRFEFLGDSVAADGKPKRVMTGHASGKITINIAEADDAIREKYKASLGEPYRTMIGHMRHEVGHFYWDRLVADSPMISAFREIFGDERQSYPEALKSYYAQGPISGWSGSFVSSYAAAHPWEDFAETWAHYFHMVGGLETAYAYGINPQSPDRSACELERLSDPYHVPHISELIDRWIPLTVAMNEMNRSMGNQDYYPFVLSEDISKKLKFVHDLIDICRDPAVRPVAVDGDPM